MDPYPNPLKWMGIDVRRLYRWAASMQGLPIEGGGFKGRTNKLVDGCYSWWVGGLFTLLEDVMGVSSSAIAHSSTTSDKTGDWSDDDGRYHAKHA
jgi:protein farnesyltransferase subunit beta